jgi:hypothetical protein
MTQNPSQAPRFAEITMVINDFQPCKNAVALNKNKNETLLSKVLLTH